MGPLGRGTLTRGNDIRASPGMTVRWCFAHCALPLCCHAIVTQIFLPSRSSSVIFFDLGEGHFEGKCGGNFAGFFRTHKRKAQKFGESFGAFFVRKFVLRKKTLRANFVLQTCHPNRFWSSLNKSGARITWVSRTRSPSLRLQDMR